MCHRSGMVREAPVGGYFDNSEPGMDKTVASLASCVLTYPPAARTKYSNSGVTIVGKVVEQVSGTPFPLYQQKRVLAPLGMSSSGFLRNTQIRRKLATGYLPVANDVGGFRELDAPVFDSVEDLRWKGPRPNFEETCRRIKAPELLRRVMAAKSALTS